MRIFEFFLMRGEHGLLHVLYRMLDLKWQKICSLKEMALMQFLRTDLIMECINEHGICVLFGE